MINTITFKERNPNIRSSLKVNHNIGSRTACLRDKWPCRKIYTENLHRCIKHKLLLIELKFFLNRLRGSKVMRTQWVLMCIYHTGIW